MPFLTQLDPNARIKGSRDPLGVQAVWTLLGREVVPNLSTVTTSVRDFTATMLGYAFAQQLEGGDADAVTVFLRWEQWAAYSRAQHFQKEAALRGIERVRERMAEGRGRVSISAAPEHQILSKQKTYGLWGLYSMPAEKSGLIDTASLRPSVESWELLQAVCWSKVKPLAEFLKKPAHRLDLETEPMVGTLAQEVLRPRFTKLERQFYTRHLLERAEDQRLAVRTMPQELRTSRPQLTPDLLRQWSDAAAACSGTLARSLERIRVAESVLTPAVWLFSWLLGQRDRRLGSVAKDLGQEWVRAFAKLEVDAFAELRAFFKNGGTEGWQRFAEALRAADYETAVREALQICAVVMQQRGGSPWITIERDALRVHAQEKPAALLARKALPQMWTHSYFLDSLAVVADALHED